jgi:hypothetical protein
MLQRLLARAILFLDGWMRRASREIANRPQWTGCTNREIERREAHCGQATRCTRKRKRR